MRWLEALPSFFPQWFVASSKSSDTLYLGACFDTIFYMVLHVLHSPLGMTSQGKKKHFFLAIAKIGGKGGGSLPKLILMLIFISEKVGQISCIGRGAGG